MQGSSVTVIDLGVITLLGYYTMVTFTSYISDLAAVIEVSVKKAVKLKTLYET